ncbi:hypothetical protein WJX77_011305 [Trebouxia sp. C0004]
MASKIVLHHCQGQIKEEQLNWFSGGMTAREYICQAATQGLAVDMVVDGLVETGLIWMEETKGVELSSSADRKVVKGRHDIASKVQPATNFVHQHRQGRGLLPKVNMGQGDDYMGASVVLKNAIVRLYPKLKK